MVRCRISIPFSIVTPITGASTPCFAAIAATRFGFGRRDQDARRRFVEQPESRGAGRESRSICAPIPPGRRSTRPAPRPGRHRSDRAPIPPGLRPRSRGWRPARAVRTPCRARAAGPRAASGSPWRIACRRNGRRRTSPTPPSSITVRPAFLNGMVTGARGLHQADDADHRRGIDAFAQRLVVQADVAAGDRRLEEAAGFGHAFDRFHQLRHDLGPLGIAEVQVVGGGHRHARPRSTDCGSTRRPPASRLRAARGSSSGRCHRATSRPTCRSP